MRKTERLPILIRFKKPPNGPIVGSLNFSGEKAPRELVGPQMIGHAFTTQPFPAAWVVSTCAAGLVLLNFIATHLLNLHINKFLHHCTLYEERSLSPELLRAIVLLSILYII